MIRSLYIHSIIRYTAYDMITYFYKDIRATQMEALERYQPGSWVCVERPSTEEMDEIVEKFSLDAGHMNDAFDADEMPRIEREGEVVYIFIRYAYVDDDLELTTAPLLFVIHPKALITVALHSMPRLQQFTGGKLEFTTTQKVKLMLQILTQIVDQYEVYINNISKRIKGIRTRLKTHEVVNQDFIDFVTIEDELNEFLGGLQPSSAILRRLAVGKFVELHEEDRELIEDLLLNNEQSIEGCRSHIRSIVNIREAHATITNNNLNRGVRTLTAATVIIALPNVFYGMYGMNVTLPFADQPWAYGMIISFTIVVIAIVIIVARKMKLF